MASRRSCRPSRALRELPRASAPPPIVDEKNPVIGIAISLGATVAAFAIGVAADNNDELETAAIVGLAPSAGRWYSGETGLGGIALRGVSLLFIAHNLDEQHSLNIECDFVTPAVCDEIEAKYERADLYIKLGFGVMVAAAAYDVVQAGLGAERYNRNRGVHVGPMMFAAQGRSTPGFVVTASF